ncbi:MAG: AAA family ATPase [Thaumarchaeota archaeon]|nr:MAG: AAA family ATPase [Nitrososphaerota archaeon]TLX94112.1 MAG: AAA family ATPase [Nitrososphaerota archaeon]
MQISPRFALISIPEVFNLIQHSTYSLKIITGNPGTGKHIVARIIAKKLKLELIDINKVAIGHGVFEKGDGTLDVDLSELKKIITKKASKNSLLVGHLAPYVVSRNNVESAVVLRRNPYKLQSVYKKRKYSYKKAIENLGSEVLGITYYDMVKKIGRNKTFQIDASDKTVSTVVKKIETLFLKGRTREDGVDWLGLILKKGDMKRFFLY